MAGVKTKKGGATKAPVWHGGDCTSCNKPIESHAKASRVLIKTFDGAKATHTWDWRHKACIGGGK